MHIFWRSERPTARPISRLPSIHIRRSLVRSPVLTPFSFLFRPRPIIDIGSSPPEEGGGGTRARKKKGWTSLGDYLSARPVGPAAAATALRHSEEEEEGENNRKSKSRTNKWCFFSAAAQSPFSAALPQKIKRLAVTNRLQKREDFAKKKGPYLKKHNFFKFEATHLT